MTTARSGSRFDPGATGTVAVGSSGRSPALRMAPWTHYSMVTPVTSSAPWSMERATYDMVVALMR